MRRAAAFLALLLSLATAAQAEDVGGQLEEARRLYQKGDLAKAATTAQAALAAIQDSLGAALVRLMPPAPAGWASGDPEYDSLAAVGGGLTVRRDYQKGDAVMNATLYLDSVAVGGAAAMFQGVGVAAPPGTRIVTLQGREAYVHFDAQTGSGEAMMIIDGRALLQVTGDAVSDAEPLLAVLRGWDVAGLRKLLGV